MIAVPAIDLRGGACVQLVGGSFADVRVQRDDPLDVAREWANAGFQRLHLVDLDAAAGVGENARIVDDILGAGDATVQVGGGVRGSERVDDLFTRGASQVIVGTRAFEDERWLADQADRYPGQIVVAADVRQRRISVRGWTRTLPIDVFDAVRDFSGLPLGGILVTVIDLEGRMEGPNLHLMEDLVEIAPFPIIASGGIASMSDLRLLQERGVESAVIGMALYTGALDARRVAEEFAQ